MALTVSVATPMRLFPWLRLHPRAWPLPGGCWVCLAWGRERLCADCRRRFAAATPRCPGCALPLPQQTLPPSTARCGSCLLHPLGLDACYTAVDYQAPWASLLQGFKYSGQLGVAEVLAPLWPLGDAPDALLPVPQHPSRLKERGFNPARHLAQALARRTGWPVQPDWLLRPLPTPPQTRLNRRQRHDNLRAAFALAPGLRLQGLHLALVDDVMTTGATLAALAELLRRHGATRVSAYVAARTPDPFT